MLHGVPVILAKLGDVLGMLIPLIAFIGWIIAQFARAKAKPAAGGGVQRGQQVQNEIDRFLREVGGGGQAPRQPPRAEPIEIDKPVQAEAPIEIVEVESVPPRLRPALSKPRATEPAAAGEPGRPGGRITQRHIPGSRETGSSVREHVAEHMQAGRVAKQVERDLGHRVEDSVDDHLGQFTGESAVEVVRRVGVRPDELVRLLGTPSGLRQAILAHEILSPPKSRRSRRDG